MLQAKALLMERFPMLGLMSGAWEIKKRILEKLPAIDLTGVQGLYVYGRADYEAVRPWLKEDGARRLVFFEDDLDHMGAFLEKELLSDNQVHIAFVQTDADLDILAEQFPFHKIEVVAPPSRRGRKFNRMRLKILRKTMLAQSLHLDRFRGDHLFAHFLQNIPHLSRSFYANALKGAFSGTPAIICGAGPSLQTDLLKTLQTRALLIAGGSTIAALSSQGIIPHFGMAVDPNPEEALRFQNVLLPTMPLLYSTRLLPAVLEGHKGPIGYMRSGIGGAPELWMEEEMGLLDPLLGSLVSPESISVTMICIAWAEFLGCNPILFNGLDLAYTNKKRYAPGVIAEETPAFDQRIRRKSRTGEWVETAVRWVMESDSIAHFAKAHPHVRFINTTTGGIGFRGIEFMELERVPVLSQERDLYAEVKKAIQNAPRLSPPDLSALKESLERVIHHLRILTGEEKGSQALAEVELKEELAASILFYDAPSDWKDYLALAIRYNLVFMQFISQRPHANA